MSIQYPAEFVRFLELRWGTGFLSPGGSEEVLKILSNIDVKGKTLLDIGCGTGGPAIVIARELDPKKIVAIDIEDALIQQAKRNVQDSGLDSSISIRRVEQGLLPFEDETFDIVFSKDSLIHIRDKTSFYQDILRVLKIEGIFAVSDWLKSEDAESLEGFNNWQTASSLSFKMQTVDEAIQDLSAAGFCEINTRDRNAWYAETALKEVEVMQDPEWQGKYASTFEGDDFQKKMRATETNAHAALCGGLRPTHLFGKRPLA